MRDYVIRFLKRIYAVKGIEYMNTLLELGTITQDEYNAVIS